MVDYRFLIKPTLCFLIVDLLLDLFLMAQTTLPRRTIWEVNRAGRTTSNRVLAIVGANLIDGKGGASIAEATVLVRGDRIVAVGPGKTVLVPKGAEVFDAKGLSLLPGLMDSHFHLDGENGLPGLFLSHGVTSVRDPGAWIEAYDEVREKERQGRLTLPRLFLAGPHLDSPPPAYPQDSIIVRDEPEARLATHRLIDSGASVIKVYFRLPLGLIRVVTETAHARGVPVTAHLEIVKADDAINYGVDGIEHVTSLGSALTSPREAESYGQSVLLNNQARREGRYKIWSGIDLKSDRVKSLLDLMVKNGVTLSPTLAVFEKRMGDKDTTEMHVRGFANMVAFVGVAKRAGVRVVVGSHSNVPHAEKGWAYQREMELLVESGLSPLETILAATLDNARFFRVEGRLGSIEPGKLADLLLVEGDPSKDITAMRRSVRVMKNGVWVRPVLVEKQ